MTAVVVVRAFVLVMMFLMIVHKPIRSQVVKLCYEFDIRVTQMQKNLLVYLWGSCY